MENRYPPTPLLQVSPPPPSTVRAAPRVLCLPTPRPRWPLLLPLLPPAVIPTSVVARKSRSAWLHRSSSNSSAILVRSLSRVGPGNFLVSSKTVVLLAFPLRAVLKQMLTSLNLIMAPPTAGVRASSGPRKVLSCQAVSRLELVEVGGKVFVGTVGSSFCFSLRAVYAVLGSIEPLHGPAFGLRPLLLRNPALDIGQGSREGELSLHDLAARVLESEPLHSGSLAAS